MSELQPEARNMQDEPGTSCHAKKQVSYQRLLRSCQKDSRANGGFPIG